MLTAIQIDLPYRRSDVRIGGGNDAYGVGIVLLAKIDTRMLRAS